MPLAVGATDLYVLNMRARLPFRYGIAALTALPHVFLRVALRLDGREQLGVAAEGLAPKWFTKDPTTTFAADLRAMLRVIEAACALARQAEPAPSVFDWQRRLEAAHAAWGAAQGFPPLLLGLGASLVERAVLDAFCRASGLTFAQAARANALGVRLGDLYPALAGTTPADWLPAQPLRASTARQTIGLGDAISGAGIPADERLSDGLPQAVDEAARAYGLTHVKIKLGGDAERDLARLRQIAAALAPAAPGYRFSLDGNEQYPSVAAFRAFWRSLQVDSALAPSLDRLLFVEQPLPRDSALGEEARAGLAAWADRPPIIVDESDAGPGTLERALAIGYAGTSHKNCKGVIRGLANACLLEARRRADPAGTYLLTGEDLAAVGPVALLQDLAVAATLGLRHVERNGHHYFAGLSMFPPDVQAAVLDRHGDLYQPSPSGFPTLRITDGRLAIGSVVDAPFGVGIGLDPSRFTPLAAWDIRPFEDADVQAAPAQP